MVINSNIEAMQNADNLNVSANRLAKSLARLSSGMKITAPSDDAAGLAVSSRMTAQIGRLDAALTNVTNAVSFTQTQDGYLKTVDSALRRMSELAMLSRDETKSSSDRSLYNAELTQLKEFIISTQDREFNQLPLFDGATLSVTIDSQGATFTLSGVDLTSASYAAAVADTLAISSATQASAALDVIKDALDKIAVDRSTLGALQTRLNFTGEQLTVTKQNLSAANSRIIDVDVAREATEFARNQILVQSGTGMLTQANSLPQQALRLLQ